MVYLIPILFSLWGALSFDISSGKKGKKFYYKLLFLYLFAIFGLRYMVGGDTSAYMEYYDNIDINDKVFWLQSGYQPLFALFSMLCKLVSPNFVIFQLLHAFFLNFILYKFFTYYSKYPFTAIFFCFFIFYINFSVEILREALAVIIFLVGFKYLETKSYIKYYICVFIAIQFHLSALFLLIIPLLQWVKFNKSYFIIIILSCVCFVWLNVVFEFISSFSLLGDRVGYYEDAFYGTNSVFLFWIIRFFIPVFLMIWCKYILRQQIVFEMLMCIMTIVGMGVLFNGMIFLRLTNYFLPFYCVFLSDTIVFAVKKCLPSNKLIAVLVCVVIIVCYGVFSFNWPPGYYRKWMPYYSVFSKEAIENRIINR